MGFENAFDEANFPCPGTVPGKTPKSNQSSPPKTRRELIATCQRTGRRYDIARLEVSGSASRSMSYACPPPPALDRRLSPQTPK
jgi:hypothetical protein